MDDLITVMMDDRSDETIEGVVTISDVSCAVVTSEARIILVNFEGKNLVLIPEDRAYNKVFKIHTDINITKLMKEYVRDDLSEMNEYVMMFVADDILKAAPLLEVA